MGDSEWGGAPPSMPVRPPLFQTPLTAPLTVKQGAERQVGCFSGLSASITSPTVRSALEQADVATTVAYTYVQEKVVPAVVEGAKTGREYVETTAVPALQRGWAYFRDVLLPAADTFWRERAVPTMLYVANDVVAPAAASTAAYTRHVVVPTTLAYYNHYANGAPLPAPDAFGVPATQAAARSTTLRPPDGTFTPSEQQHEQPFEQLPVSNHQAGTTHNVAAPTEDV